MKYEKKYYETDKKKLEENWQVAIGLQEVDNLKPSEYLISVAKRNINGELTYEEVHQLLYSHYDKMSSEDLALRKKECDIVSARIADYLSNYSFSLTPETYRGIHEYLFENIYTSIAGEYRTANLTKREPILHGCSVVYTDFRRIKETLNYDFEVEKSFNYKKCDKTGMIKRIATFICDIWQVHPFWEGNTRTTALFTECYLNSLGFNVDNKLFASKARYFRNALVRANYADMKNNIFPESSYLEAFFENLIFDGKHKLESKNLIITLKA